jgi:catecholate siderophore receptor
MMASALAAACFIASTAPAAAQSQPADLPAVTVDQPKPVVSRKRPPAKPAASTAGQTTAAPATPPVVAAPTISRAPDGNPYADPAAPYKVDKVSSKKFTQPILDTPKTIVTIPKEVIDDKNATSLRDLARTTAGVTLGSGEGGNAFGDRLFIRGFDARNDVYVDGFRDPSVNIHEDFNVDQMEILKGPSSSVTGRGSTGGALNIVTKEAVDKSFYDSTSTLGTDATRRGTVDVNQVLNDNASVRVNLMGQLANVAGRDKVFDDRWGAAVSTKMRAGDDVTIFADYQHLYLNQLPDWGVPTNQATHLPWTESGLNRDSYYGLASRDFQHTTSDIGTLKGEWQLDDSNTVSSKLRYGRTVLDYLATAPERTTTTNPNPALWTVASNPQSLFQVVNTVANQTDITSKFELFGFQHTIVNGIEIDREQVQRNTYVGLSSEGFPSATTTTGTINYNLFNPNENLPFVGTPILGANPTTTTVNTQSVYSNDTIKLTDKLLLNGGIRLDNYNITLVNNTTNAAHKELLFNWNAGITYKLLPQGSIYAAYATSSNPVGDELDATSDSYGGLTVANSIFKAERNTSAEVGTKWELFDRHLLATASLFQTTKDNARETIGSGAAATLLASAAYRVRGVEFGGTGNITDRWSVYSGLVLMQSEVTKSAVASNVGLPIGNIAHQSFNVLSKYRITDEWTLGGQATYKSKIYGGQLAATAYAIPSYWRFDAFSDYQFTKNLSVKVSVNNVFNQLYYDSLYRSATPFVYVAPGRSAYLTLSAKF